MGGCDLLIYKIEVASSVTLHYESDLMNIFCDIESLVYN